MTKLRLLIVDDELLARDRLRSFLLREDTVEIVGQCASGSEAVDAIRRGRPDVVILDIQMPGGDGMQVAADLPVDHRPVIIFVTAHDRYALEAFGQRAVDYLLKPFDRARLQLALRRASEQVRARREGDLGMRVETLLTGARARNNERVAFRSDGRVVFLRLNEIVWVEAANNNSILHLAGDNLLVLHETLFALEQRLGPAGFVRINRSAMVHFDQVKELRPAIQGEFVVVLQDGLRLTVSRQRRGAMQKFIPREP